jgi:hypothetical protein
MAIGWWGRLGEAAALGAIDDHRPKMIIRGVTPKGRFSSGFSEDDHRACRNDEIRMTNDELGEGE